MEWCIDLYCRRTRPCDSVTCLTDMRTECRTWRGVQTVGTSLRVVPMSARNSGSGMSRWVLSHPCLSVCELWSIIQRQSHSLTTRHNSTTSEQQQLFYSPLSGTAKVSRYQKKHSPTHTYHDYQPSFISFLCPLWSIASSMFNLRAWQSFCTTFLQVFFGLPLGLDLEPSSLYAIYFFIQLLSSFHNTCPYYRNLFRNLFCCSPEIMSSILLSLYLKLLP